MSQDAATHRNLWALTVLLYPYLPSSAETLLAALGAAGETGWDGARLGARGGGAPVGALEPLFPKR